MSFDFSGRSAIVTGAGRGIGAAIARELHAGGARVSVADVDLDSARAMAAAPMRLHASATTTNSHQLGNCTATMSPASTPMLRNAAAQRATWSPNSRRLTRRAPSRSAR